MYPAIADALQAQDLVKAADLLAIVAVDAPDNPWIAYYRGCLAEAQGDWNTAETHFRDLLTQASNPKLLTKVRAGLARIQAHHQQIEQEAQAQRRQALEAARQTPSAQGTGIFVLEPVPPDNKQTLAQAFAPIFHVDPYTARLQLPSRAWRLYRTGNLGELQYFQRQCEAAAIPCFCVNAEDLPLLSVYPIIRIEQLVPEVTVTYRHSQDEHKQFTFTWDQVGQWVEGLLPIFDECVSVTVQGKMEYKTTILDYGKIFDLHLPEKRIILRFCDQIYEFNQGISLPTEETRRTAHGQWQSLIQLVQTHLPALPLFKDFQPFAETALDFPELLKLIDPHIPFLRREDTPWDAAFQLYSGLAFCRAWPPSAD